MSLALVPFDQDVQIHTVPKGTQTTVFVAESSDVGIVVTRGPRYRACIGGRRYERAETTNHDDPEASDRSTLDQLTPPGIALANRRRISTSPLPCQKAGCCSSRAKCCDATRIVLARNYRLNPIGEAVRVGPKIRELGRTYSWLARTRFGPIEALPREAPPRLAIMLPSKPGSWSMAFSMGPVTTGRSCAIPLQTTQITVPFSGHRETDVLSVSRANQN